MRIAYIIHGWDGSPKEPLIQWLKASLIKSGFAVITPMMPEPAAPKVAPWVEKLQETVQSDEEAVIVAHSIGCQAALRFLEAMPRGSGIANLVLIAPWMELDETYLKEESMETQETTRPWMETPINFEKVKPHVKRITAIFSDNDPYIPLSQKDVFKGKLGATIVVEHEKGHFDTASGVQELPSALAAAEDVPPPEARR